MSAARTKRRYAAAEQYATFHTMRSKHALCRRKASAAVIGGPRRPLYATVLTIRFSCLPNFRHNPLLEPSTEARKKECTMKFSLNIKRFSRDEDGAVTVDWVVLTAAIVGLAVVAFHRNNRQHRCRAHRLRIYG